MEQLPRGRDGVELAYRLVVVNRQIAQILEHPRLRKHCRADRVAKRRLVNQRAQMFLVRQLERRVVLVEPMHRQFERAPRVEARRSRIGIRRRFRLARSVVQVGPFGFEEPEVAHAIRLMRFSKPRRDSSKLSNGGGSARNMSRIAR